MSVHWLFRLILSALVVAGPAQAQSESARRPTAMRTR